MANFYKYLYIDEESEALRTYGAEELQQDIETFSEAELEEMRQQALNHYFSTLDSISALKAQIAELWHEIRTNNDLEQIIKDQLEKIQEDETI